MKSFLTRLLSGIILVALIFATCWYGGGLLWLFLLLIGYIGQMEFYKVFGIQDKSPGFAGYLGTALWMMGVHVASGGGLTAKTEGMWLILMVVFLLIMAVYVFTFPKYDTQQIMAAFFGIVYVPVMLSFIYQTRMLESGLQLVWLIFFCSWGCDTFAYCTGMLLGKHKLAPVLSPKKSIEGAVGGVAGAALLGAVYAGIMTAPVLEYALICAVGAVASQIGDLAASAIKRQHGIKDYGRLIPGHGGILDRFDSVIVTAPMIYILAVALIG
ncbi:MAG: phosphatidate cytidylyltransferase [Clostridiales bacterium]|nr:phosphatidate cytidylyltransferase [Clostridiales bacterium]